MSLLIGSRIDDNLAIYMIQKLTLKFEYSALNDYAQNSDLAHFLGD